MESRRTWLPLLLIVSFVDAYNSSYVASESRLGNLGGDGKQTPWLSAGLRAILVSQRCGRKQNRFVRLSNGEEYCVLYRANLEQVASETLSFRLAQLIGIQQVPAGFLVTFNSSHPMWLPVSNQVSNAGWKDGHPLIFVRFLQGLRPVYFPPRLAAVLIDRLGKSANSKLDETQVSSMNDSAQIRAIEQFAELIVFDYLTCNTDRTVSNLHSLQWNDETLSFPVRNVYHGADSLVLLDNESGMLHGFRMLSQYGHYLQELLRSVCYFRSQLKQSVQAALSSFEQQDAHLLVQLDSDGELWTPSLTRALQDSVPVIKHRLTLLNEHFARCASELSV